MSGSGRLLLLLLVGGVLVRLGAGCLCHIFRDYKCPAPPTCCESGMYTTDECGCCMKCAKAELQTCGGPSDSLGKCANGLQCLKTCLSCQTVGSSGKPCVFPFKYREKTYDKCTSKDSDNGQPWCATAIAEDGYVVDGAWGDCDEGCPGTRIECDDRYFSILEGTCIDPAVPGAIPNWFGAPAVKLLDTTKDLFPAPFCATKGASKRKYKNTCRCAEGETAVDYGTDGRPRGNCTGADEKVGDNLDKVFCFLENIRDPLDPFSGCYSDTKWSSRDGRFWSSLACTLAPDVGYEEPKTQSSGTRNKPNANPPNRNKPNRNQPNNNNRRDEQIRRRLQDRRPGPKIPTTRRTTKRPKKTSPKPEVTTQVDYYSVFEYSGEDYVEYGEYKGQVEDEVEDTTVFAPIIINDRKSSGPRGDIRGASQPKQKKVRRKNGNRKPIDDNEPEEERYKFIPGKTNLKGFSEDISDYEGEEYYYDEIAPTEVEEKSQTQIVGPFLPTPVPSHPAAQVRTTQRPARKRRPFTPRPRRRDHTEFPNFKRRNNNRPRNKERPNFDPRKNSRRKNSRRKPTRPTTVNPIETSEDNFLDIESRTHIPASFLEGEFGAENIPIAIPLFSEEIFQKIITTSAPDFNLPSPQFDGAILLGVETQTKKPKLGELPSSIDYPDHDNDIQQGSPGTAIRLDASSFFDEEKNEEKESNFEDVDEVSSVNDEESLSNEDVVISNIYNEESQTDVDKSLEPSEEIQNNVDETPSEVKDDEPIESISNSNVEVDQSNEDESENNDANGDGTERINLFKNLPGLSGPEDFQEKTIPPATPTVSKIEQLKATIKPTVKTTVKPTQSTTQQTTIQTVFVFDDIDSTESSAEAVKTTAKRSPIQYDSTESSAEIVKTTPQKQPSVDTIQETPRSTQLKDKIEVIDDTKQHGEIKEEDITDKIKNVIDLGVLGLWSNAKPRKPRDQATSPMPVFRPKKQGTDTKFNR